MDPTKTSASSNPLVLDQSPAGAEWATHAWSLGHEPERVLATVAGGAGGPDEVQDRLDHFMTTPAGRAMPAELRRNIRALGHGILDADPETPPEQHQGSWVTLAQGGQHLHLFAGPDGRVRRGPLSLHGVALTDLGPRPGERALTHHPPGHLPPQHDAHPRYAEHPGAPLPLSKEQAHLGLLRALVEHDLAALPVDYWSLGPGEHRVADS